MKTLNTPYTMHENTVMESEFDEVQTKATASASPIAARLTISISTRLPMPRIIIKAPSAVKSFSGSPKSTTAPSVAV